MKTALITGASAGLGIEFARCFAADGHAVVLVARRRDKLETLASELRARHGVEAHVLVADLSDAAAVHELVRELKTARIEIDYLVNNAGFGTNSAFHNLDPARELELIQVNVSALVALTGALLPGMVARGNGRILNIGSTAGFQPGPYMATYYASKAFVLSFSEALSYELRATGVTVTVSCPGPIRTEFADIAGLANSRLFRLNVASAESVARTAYQALHAGRPLVVHGFSNKLGVLLVRLSPRAWVRAVVGTLNQAPTSAGVTTKR